MRCVVTERSVGRRRVGLKVGESAVEVALTQYTGPLHVLKRFTPYAIAWTDDLRRELAEVNGNKYARSDQERAHGCRLGIVSTALSVAQAVSKSLSRGTEE